MTHVICVHVCLVAQSCLTLCNPLNCSSPGSSLHGFFFFSFFSFSIESFLFLFFFPKKEYWSELLCPPLGDLPNSEISLCLMCLQGIFLTQELIPPLMCLLRGRQVLYPLNHWESSPWEPFIGLQVCSSR